MAKWTSETSETCSPKTSEASLNATGSPASVDGVTHSDSPDGQMTDLFGRVVAPASPSQPQANKKDSLTSAISGLTGSGLSEHVGHPSSSESRSPQPSEDRITKTRTCLRCQVEKPYSEFYVNSKGNRPHTCKECFRARERGYKRARTEAESAAYKAWREKHRGYALVNVARYRAKRKGLPCSLMSEEIQARIDRGSCEITGIPFDLTKPRSWNSPSLDRINPSEGYTPENVRVILFCLNVMANVWGIQKVVEVGNAILAQRTKHSEELSERLKERLEARLTNRGSTLFETTWKRKATPAGRPYWELAPSARSTSDSDSTSWPSPSPWATPTTRDHKDGASVGTAPVNALLGRQVWLAAPTTSPTGQAMLVAPWPTPNAGPQNDTDSTWEQRRADLKAQHKNGNGFGMTLGMAVSLSGWPTPMAGTPATETYNEAGSTDYERQIDVAMGLRETKNGPKHSGPPATGSTAETGSIGQLNPAHSRWLMGYPPAWDACAVTAMRLRPSARRRSSKPTVK